MKPKLKVYFCGKGWNNATETNYPYMKELSKFAEVVIDRDADLIFARENSSSLSEFYRLRKPNQIKVFSATEAFAPNFNEFDFAMGFDPINYGDRYLRRNTLHRFEDFFDYSQIIEPVNSQENWTSRRDVSFIYSNAHAHKFRDDFYFALNKEINVDSMGRHLKTRRIKENSTDWRENKIEMERGYRFSIAIENAFHFGYTSEKIITSFLAGSIPLYFGNPEIHLDFNPARFVNLHNFETIETAVKYVVELSSSPERQMKILDNAVLTPEQLVRYRNFRMEFSSFFEKIVESAKSCRSTTPVGTFQNRIHKVRRTSYQFETLLLNGWKLRRKIFKG